MLILLLLAAPAYAGVPRGGGPAPASVVRIFNWQTYIDKEILRSFETDTGIKVVYNEYDDNSILDARVMRRGSGYDVVVPSAQPYLSRQIKAGAYQPLQKEKIPNLANLDPKLMKLVQAADPDNKYGVIYQWGTTGILYNIDMVRQRLPDAPLDSWDLVFRPENMAKLKDCGVAVLDSPVEVYPLALRYLGLSPTSTALSDLLAAEKVLTAVRPYIKYFHSSRYIDDLAEGRLCAVIGYSGDYVSARDKAAENDQKNDISYVIPKEGTVVWFDMMAVPADAPNPDAAHAFINYMLRPEMMAKVSNAVGFANAVPASVAFMNWDIKSNPLIYPTEETRQTLFVLRELPPDFERAMQQSWARMRASGVGAAVTR